MVYRILADEHHYIIRDGGPDHRWDSGDSGLNVRVRSIYASDPSHARLGWVTPRDLCPSDAVRVGETAFLVVCKWADGDTFGSSEYWCVACVKATAEAAQAAVEELSERAGYSVPWNGYFADLSSIEVEPLTLLA